jgi:hypothetical protein
MDSEMTTVAQLIEKLLTYPQTAEVEVARLYEEHYSSHVEFVPVDLEGIVVYDFTSAKDRRTSPKFAGRVILELNGISE